MYSLDGVPTRFLINLSLDCLARAALISPRHMATTLIARIDFWKSRNLTPWTCHWTKHRWWWLSHYRVLFALPRSQACVDTFEWRKIHSRIENIYLICKRNYLHACCIFSFFKVNASIIKAIVLSFKIKVINMKSKAIRSRPRTAYM